jgi:hypothetical protein
MSTSADHAAAAAAAMQLAAASSAMHAPTGSPHGSPRGSISVAGVDPQVLQELATLRTQVQQLGAHAMQQQQLQQQQQAPPAPRPTGVSHLKISPPSLFKGEMGFVVDDWITELEQQFVFYGAAFAADEEKVRFALAYIRGAAMNWWKYEPNQAAATASWAEFVKRLHGRFRPVQAAAIARQRLDRLHQKGGHSVNAYANHFQVMLTPITDMSSADQVHHFVKGLQPHIAAKVYDKSPKDLRAAIDAAVSAEAMGNFGRSAAHAPAHSSSAPMDLNAVEQESQDEEDSDSAVPAAAATAPSTDSVVRALLTKMEAMEHRLAAMSVPASKVSGNRGDPGDKVPGLKSEDIDRLRREGKCFRCKQSGHMKRDCPRRPKA